MSTYAIGDIQGCYDELQNLLQLIQFNPHKDRLWFAGDLINRGPKSLEVLRFVKNLNQPIVVLGNHDLHLLILANGHPYKKHTLHDILTAPDRDELVNWLRQQPLFHYDAQLGYVMTHAGIPPQWSIAQAKNYAAEVEAVLQSEHYSEFLEHLYNYSSGVWNPDADEWDKLCYITDALTRMRFCDEKGNLDLKIKGGLDSQPPGYLPWFAVPNRAAQNIKIVFGHWAALEGQTNTPNVYALDTGCVWGRYLTAMRLEDGQRFSVKALRPY